MALKFFKKIAFFSLPLLVIFLILEAGIYYYANDKLWKAGDLCLILNQKTKIKTLFIGDSHLLSVKPEEIDDSTALFWVGAMDLYYMDQLISKKFSDFPNLRTVVIDLNYFTFANSNTIHNPKVINDYFLMGISPDSYSFDYRYLSTLYSKNEQLYELFKMKVLSEKPLKNGEENFLAEAPDKNSKANFNVLRQLLTEDEFEGHSKFKNKEHGDVIEYAKKDRTIIQKNQSYLSHIDRILKQKKIRVIYIQTPHHKSYLKNFKFLKEYYAELAKFKKNKNIEFYDFSRLYADSTAYFRDSDHLNDKGATYFTQVMNQIIKH